MKNKNFQISNMQNFGIWATFRNKLAKNDL
jgi:hypothetical protein